MEISSGTRPPSSLAPSLETPAAAHELIGSVTGHQLTVPADFLVLLPSSRCCTGLEVSVWGEPLKAVYWPHKHRSKWL